MVLARQALSDPVLPLCLSVLLMQLHMILVHLHIYENEQQQQDHIPEENLAGPPCCMVVMHACKPQIRANLCLLGESTKGKAHVTIGFKHQVV